MSTQNERETDKDIQTKANLIYKCALYSHAFSFLNKNSEENGEKRKKYQFISAFIKLTEKHFCPTQ